MALTEQSVLDFQTFPALSEIQKPIRNGLTQRVNSFAEENKPRTVWIRLISNARSLNVNPRKGWERDNIFIMTGAGTLDSQNKIRSGFSNMYDYQRLDNVDRLFRPSPGIDSISITNMGEWGSLRKATIQWFAPSIQDLDELSPYFLTPGITMLLEWGWGDLETQIKSVDISQNENKLKEKMTSYFKNPFQLFQKQCDSNGRYDVLIGMVSHFAWTINDDGSFSCTTEITSMGQLMAGVNLVEQLNYTNPDEKDTQKKTIKEYITKDFDKNIQITKKQLPKEETREYGVIDVDIFIDNGTLFGLFGKDTWVSWGFIEDIIINEHMKVVADVVDGFKPLEIDSRGVLISNDPFLATTDPDVMIISKGQNTTLGVRPFDVSDDEYSGVLRAIYVNVKVIKDIFEKSETLQEALKQILNRIQVAAENIWNFKLYVDPIRDKLRIIDLNYVSALADQINPKEVFSFGGFGSNSIIKGLSLQTDLTNQMSLKFAYAINKDTMTESNSSINDRSDVGLKTLYGNYRDLVLEKLRLENPKSDGSGQGGISKGVSDVTEINREKSNLDEDQLKELIKSGQRIEVEGTNFIALNSVASEYLAQYLRRRTIDNRRRHQNLLVPLKVDITIDGTSGLIPGNIFRIENIPKIYFDIGVFQVISVNHTINNDNWDTNIQAIYRFIDIDDELVQRKPKKGIQVPLSDSLIG